MTTPPQRKSDAHLAAEEVSTMMDRGYNVRHGTHGTTMPEGGETTGTHILPSSQRPGKDVSFDMSDSSQAYYSAHHETQPAGAHTAAEVRGWTWAGMAAKARTDYESPTGNVNAVRSRQVVHEVTAEGPLKADQNINKGGRHGSEMTANRLRITDTHWIPSPSSINDIGVQGTLPHINWNQHAPNDGERRPDANSVNLQHQQGVIGRKRADQEYVAQQDRNVAARTQLPGQMSLGNGGPVGTMSVSRGRPVPQQSQARSGAAALGQGVGRGVPRTASILPRGSNFQAVEGQSAKGMTRTGTRDNPTSISLGNKAGPFRRRTI